MLKFEVAAVVGVPEIVSVIPVEAPSANPAGREPITLQVNGPEAVVEATDLKPPQELIQQKTFVRADVEKALNCSESSAKRAVAVWLKAGLIERKGEFHSKKCYYEFKTASCPEPDVGHDAGHDGGTAEQPG